MGTKDGYANNNYVNKDLWDTDHFLRVPTVRAAAKAKGVAEAKVGIVPKEQAAVPRPEIHEGDPSLPDRLRLKLGWWQHHAFRAVLDILTRGLLPEVHLPCISSAPPPCAHPPHSLEYQFALEMVREYLDIGSLEPCLLEDIMYIVPWFIVLKKDVLPDGLFIYKGRFACPFWACRRNTSSGTVRLLNLEHSILFQKARLVLEDVMRLPER